MEHPSFLRLALDVQTLLMLPIQVTSWKGLIVRRARHLGPLFRDKPAMTKPEDGKS